MSSMLLLLILLPGCMCYESFTYSDCSGTSPNAIHISTLSISPYPLVLPSRVNASANFQIFRNLTEGLKLGIRLVRKVSFLGLETEIEIPCLFNVGSCDYDFCDFLNMFKVTGQQICRWQLARNNIPCTCPIPANTYSLPLSEFRLPPVSGILSWFAEGDYRVRFTLTNPRNQEQIGCYDVSISIGNS